MIILWSVIIMLAISLFLGIMIAVFAKVFEVKVDPKVEKLTEALPSINCGACGYPGCAQYAEALVEADADPKLCKPGGADVIKQIEEILKEEL